MSFINTHFSHADDLENVDSQINALETHRIHINAAVQRKMASDGPSSTQDASAAAVGRFLDETAALMPLLDPKTALLLVDQLRSQYGPVPVLLQLGQLFSDRQRLQKRGAFLNEAAALGDEIDALSGDITTIEKTHVKLAHLGLEVPEAADQLKKHLGAKIDASRLHHEKLLAEQLALVKWLSKTTETASIAPPKLKGIVASFSALVQLQAIANKPVYPDSWWALDVLLGPVITRFNYHFSSANKETNKLSKPEWAFNFVETFLAEDMLVVELLVGDILQKQDKISVYEVITSILKPLREKIFAMVHQLSANIARFRDDDKNLETSGKLLSHLVYEMTSFDQRLRNLYKYNPYIDRLLEAPSKKWAGLSGDVFLHSTGENLPVSKWLDFEFRLAKKQFDREIVAAENALSIEYDYQVSDKDSTNRGVLKPTQSAYNLVKLFNNLTSHYRTLGIVKYQLKYVSSIQLKLVDSYCETIKLALKRFNDSFNLKLVYNFIPGGLSDPSTSAQDLTTNGLKGLEMLTEIYCLTKFVRENLDEWGEELIFIQLWNAVKTVSAKTNAEELTIFDHSTAQYDELIEKVLKKYEDFFRKEIKNFLKDYVNSSQWNLELTIGAPEPSSKLSLLVTGVLTYLGFLRKCISDVDYYFISDRITSILSQILHEYILTNNRFSRHGIEQFKTDLQFVVEYTKNDLLLGPLEYSNSDNSSYLKLQESVELMLKTDPLTAKVVRKQYDALGEIRLQFESRLGHLLDHDMADLLHRIV